MKTSIFLVLFSVFLFSCGKDIPKVKHVIKSTQALDLTSIKVVNSNDPICEMSTAKYLKDTTIYKGKIFGFCSEGCKSAFKKNPEKYGLHEK